LIFGDIHFKWFCGFISRVVLMDLSGGRFIANGDNSLVMILRLPP
jgi:hypothetical protein